MKRILRNILLFFASISVKLLWIFPIRNKQLMFLSFRGQFSDSPKYIFDYISEKKRNYKYVWVSKTVSQKIPSKCKTVKAHGLRFFYNLATSKVIITNDFLNTYYPRRRGQTIINTWHGGSQIGRAHV